MKSRHFKTVARTKIASSLSPRATARLGCVLLRRTQLLIMAIAVKNNERILVSVGFTRGNSKNAFFKNQDCVKVPVKILGKLNCS